MVSGGDLEGRVAMVLSGCKDYGELIDLERGEVGMDLNTMVSC